MPVRARTTLLLAVALLAASSAAAGASGSPRPCTARSMTLAGHRAVAYCGPATVTLSVGGRTYRFRGGLCDRSATLDGLEILAGTRVAGAPGNAGMPFISIVIAQLPSESEALTAYWGGHALIPDSVIAQPAGIWSKGPFTSFLGPPFSGTWNCHGVIWYGP